MERCISPNRRDDGVSKLADMLRFSDQGRTCLFNRAE
jgi:hypothetical protein